MKGVNCIHHSHPPSRLSSIEKLGNPGRVVEMVPRIQLKHRANPLDGIFPRHYWTLQPGAQRLHMLIRLTDTVLIPILNKKFPVPKKKKENGTSYFLHGS